MHTIVNTPKAMAAIGPYNQAIRVGSIIFTSGQLGIDPKTGQLADGLDAQILQTFSNLQEVLRAAGAGLKDVVKLNIHLKDMADFDHMNDMMRRYLLGMQHPARTCTQPIAMPKGALFLLDAVAILEE